MLSPNVDREGFMLSCCHSARTHAAKAVSCDVINRFTWVDTVLVWSECDHMNKQCPSLASHSEPLPHCRHK